ncbi:hypothetical protein [Lysinibacillus capsici]|uniref:hypothetical protein n=1 Tax=Lysinibacillus capsici TaxID=2115968 RepID=UPI0024818190|nr:hypothetical protein [Lysinibacillus capsici]
MRNVLNNNKGYALALVLIISILFTVIFFSFLAISSNTTKQHNIVESTFQSQTIAEMGVGYFQSAMTNEIISNQTQIIQNVITQRDQDRKKNIIKQDAYYVALAMSTMQNRLQNIANTLNKTVTIHQNNKNSFNINPTNEGSFFAREGERIIIAFTSTGYDEIKNAEIKGTITVDFSNMIVPKTNEDTDSSAIPTGNTIADPGTNLKICPSGKKENLSNESCQIQGSIAYHQNENLILSNTIFRVSGDFKAGNMNNDRLEKSTLYILGSMMTGNLNTTNNLKLHVNGALTVGNFNGSGLSNSVIEVGGNASMGVIKLNKSTIYINDGRSYYDPTIKHINDMQDSIIFINSDTVIGDTQLGNNAKICVNGHLKIGNINNNFKKTSNIYAKSSNNPAVITNHDEFEAACVGGAIPTPSPGSIDYTTEYEYSY